MSDPHIQNVVSLLKFEGPDGSETFTDSANNFVWSNHGATISTSQSKFGGSSGRFVKASKQHISRDDTESNGFFGVSTDDWTAELFVYPNSIPSSGNFYGLICQRQSYSSSQVSFTTSINPNNLLFEVRNDANVKSQIIHAANVTVGQWNHVAMTRQGSTVYAFLDGNLVGTDSISGAIRNTAQPLRIGAFDTPVFNASYLDGYIDSVRITKGVARYTASFTPPTEPFPTPLFSVGGVFNSSPSGAVATIRAFRWDTGEMLHEVGGVASGNSYQLSWLGYDGDVLVVAQPDTGYRPLAHGPVIPSIL